MSVIKHNQSSATFTHTYNINPFIWKKFPDSFDRFVITIVCKNITDNESLILKNLIIYILNSFVSPNILQHNSTSQIKKELSNLEKSNKDLKNNVAIIDITNGLFSDVKNQVLNHFNVSRINDLENNKQLDNYEIPQILLKHNILSVNFPNKILNTINNYEKNFSHTIWLSDKIPSELSTMSHMIFVFDSDLVKEYASKFLGINDINIIPNNIFVFEKLLSLNLSISTINKNRFIEES